MSTRAATGPSATSAPAEEKAQLLRRSTSRGGSSSSSHHSSPTRTTDSDQHQLSSTNTTTTNNKESPPSKSPKMAHVYHQKEQGGGGGHHPYQDSDNEGHGSGIQGGGGGGESTRFGPITETILTTLSQDNLFLICLLFVELLGVILVILATCWMLQIGGLGFADKLIFNFHPILMTLGMIFLNANGILIYRSTRTLGYQAQKRLHFALQTAMISTSWLGFLAAYLSHAWLSIPHFYSLHSWLGLAALTGVTISLVSSYLTFLYPKANPIYRRTMKPESARNLPPIYRLPDKTVLAKKVISDFVVIFILLLGIILFYAIGQPFHRGFNCDDDSIRYPYRNNTISGTANYLYSTLIPAGTFAVNEFFIIRSHFSAHSDALRQPLFWRFYGWQVYLQLIPLGFAATTSQFLTDVSKYSIGRLRPHFIDLCRPQLPNGLVMDRFSNCQNPHTYVTEYTCFKDNLSMSSRKMKDVRLSFMSGHSSFAAVCLVYLVLYLHLRMRAAHLALVKHLYQAALLYLVFYTGMSRISDYKHHWSDVLCGLLQGTLVAILVAYFVGDLVKPRSYENMQQITVGQLMSGSSSGTNGGSSATNGDSSSNGAFKDIHQVESGV